jgi:hypothetical protein
MKTVVLLLEVVVLLLEVVVLLEVAVGAVVLLLGVVPLAAKVPETALGGRSRQGSMVTAPSLTILLNTPTDAVVVFTAIGQEEKERSVLKRVVKVSNVFFISLSYYFDRLLALIVFFIF